MMPVIMFEVGFEDAKICRKEIETAACV